MRNIQCNISKFYQSILASSKIIVILSQTISKYQSFPILPFNVSRLPLFYSFVCYLTIFLIWYEIGFFAKITLNISLEEERK